jgi:hypothetical protein
MRGCIDILRSAVASRNAGKMQLARREVHFRCSRRPDCCAKDVDTSSHLHPRVIPDYRINDCLEERTVLGWLHLAEGQGLRHGFSHLWNQAMPASTDSGFTRCGVFCWMMSWSLSGAFAAV